MSLDRYASSNEDISGIPLSTSRSATPYSVLNEHRFDELNQPKAKSVQRSNSQTPGLRSRIRFNQSPFRPRGSSTSKQRESSGVRTDGTAQARGELLRYAEQLHVCGVNKVFAEFSEEVQDLSGFPDVHSKLWYASVREAIECESLAFVEHLIRHCGSEMRLSHVTGILMLPEIMEQRSAMLVGPVLAAQLSQRLDKGPDVFFQTYELCLHSGLLSKSLLPEIDAKGWDLNDVASLLPLTQASTLRLDEWFELPPVSDVLSVYGGDSALFRALYAHSSDQLTAIANDALSVALSKVSCAVLRTATTALWYLATLEMQHESDGSSSELQDEPNIHFNSLLPYVNNDNQFTRFFATHCTGQTTSKNLPSALSVTNIASFFSDTLYSTTPLSSSLDAIRAAFHVASTQDLGCDGDCMEHVLTRRYTHLNNILATFSSFINVGSFTLPSVVHDVLTRETVTLDSLRMLPTPFSLIMLLPLVSCIGQCRNEAVHDLAAAWRAEPRSLLQKRRVDPKHIAWFRMFAAKVGSTEHEQGKKLQTLLLLQNSSLLTVQDDRCTWSKLCRPLSTCVSSDSAHLLQWLHCLQLFCTPISALHSFVDELITGESEPKLNTTSLLIWPYVMTSLQALPLADVVFLRAALQACVPGVPSSLDVLHRVRIAEQGLDTFADGGGGGNHTPKPVRCSTINVHSTLPRISKREDSTCSEVSTTAVSPNTFIAQEPLSPLYYTSPGSHHGTILPLLKSTFSELHNERCPYESLAQHYPKLASVGICVLAAVAASPPQQHGVVGLDLLESLHEIGKIWRKKLPAPLRRLLSLLNSHAEQLGQSARTLQCLEILVLLRNPTQLQAHALFEAQLHPSQGKSFYTFGMVGATERAAQKLAQTVAIREFIDSIVSVLSDEASKVDVLLCLGRETHVAKQAVLAWVWNQVRIPDSTCLRLSQEITCLQVCESQNLFHLAQVHALDDGLEATQMRLTKLAKLLLHEGHLTKQEFVHTLAVIYQAPCLCPALPAEFPAEPLIGFFQEAKRLQYEQLHRYISAECGLQVKADGTVACVSDPTAQVQEMYAELQRVVVSIGRSWVRCSPMTAQLLKAAVVSRAGGFLKTEKETLLQLVIASAGLHEIDVACDKHSIVTLLTELNQEHPQTDKVRAIVTRCLAQAQIEPAAASALFVLDQYRKTATEHLVTHIQSILSQLPVVLSHLHSVLVSRGVKLRVQGSHCSCGVPNVTTEQLELLQCSYLQLKRLDWELLSRFPSWSLNIKTHCLGYCVVSEEHVQLLEMSAVSVLHACTSLAAASSSNTVVLDEQAKLLLQQCAEPCKTRSSQFSLLMPRQVVQLIHDQNSSLIDTDLSGHIICNSANEDCQVFTSTSTCDVRLGFGIPYTESSSSSLYRTLHSCNIRPSARDPVYSTLLASLSHRVGVDHDQPERDVALGFSPSLHLRLAKIKHEKLAENIWKRVDSLQQDDTNSVHTLDTRANHVSLPLSTPTVACLALLPYNRIQRGPFHVSRSSQHTPLQKHLAQQLSVYVETVLNQKTPANSTRRNSLDRQNATPISAEHTLPALPLAEITHVTEFMEYCVMYSHKFAY